VSLVQHPTRLRRVAVDGRPVAHTLAPRDVMDSGNALGRLFATWDGLVVAARPVGSGSFANRTVTAPHRQASRQSPTSSSCRPCRADASWWVACFQIERLLVVHHDARRDVEP
jgi:hypothetical protein